MRETSKPPQDIADWHAGGRERLFFSMLLSSVLVSAALSMLRLPDVPGSSSLLQLVIEIVREQEEPSETPPPAEPVQPDSTPVSPDQDEVRPDRSPADPSPAALTEAREPPAPELEVAREAAIEAYLRRLEDPPGVNPNVDRLEREFAGRYQPPTVEPPKPVWENVERDSLGRSILRSGDCWRVIDDPNVASQEAFREFGQFIVMCDVVGRKPRELPWVDGIRERYPYLKYPDGEMTDEAAGGEARASQAAE